MYCNKYIPKIPFTRCSKFSISTIKVTIIYFKNTLENADFYCSTVFWRESVPLLPRHNNGEQTSKQYCCLVLLIFFTQPLSQFLLQIILFLSFKMTKCIKNSRNVQYLGWGNLSFFEVQLTLLFYKFQFAISTISKTLISYSGFIYNQVVKENGQYFDQLQIFQATWTLKVS